MMLPTRPRCTASGFTMMKVRSRSFMFRDAKPRLAERSDAARLRRSLALRRPQRKVMERHAGTRTTRRGGITRRTPPWRQCCDGRRWPTRGRAPPVSRQPRVRKQHRGAPAQPQQHRVTREPASEMHDDRTTTSAMLFAGSAGRSAFSSAVAGLCFPWFPDKSNAAQRHSGRHLPTRTRRRDTATQAGRVAGRRAPGPRWRALTTRSDET
jgi:hypothetical protein